jgi:CRISPR-associated protein Csx14
MMAETSIPVDLFNPGQVFACLGFLEAADVLIGNAEGGFDWSVETNVRFVLRVSGNDNPITEVLKFLASAIVKELEPQVWPGDKVPEAIPTAVFPSTIQNHFDKQEKKWTRTKFPIRLLNSENDGSGIDLLNWTDGSTRPLFKLYSGNRSACSIAGDMLFGKRGNPTKNNPQGKVEKKGLLQLWDEQRTELIADPLNVLCSIGGSFNFDPRGAWTALDAGFSPDRQKKVGNIDGIASSPVVEMFAAWGMEHARPDEYETRQVRYSAWGRLVPPILARPALACANIAIPIRRFRFTLALSGKNKVVTFAQEETNQ